MAEGKRRVSKRLTAAEVRNAKPGRHADGDGLYLEVDDRLNSRWLFLSQVGGRRREKGLGSARDVSLAEARDKAAEARRAIREGRDPFSESREVERAQNAPMTFGQAADALLAAKELEWRNDKHRAQWRMTLTKYAAPLAKMPVAEVDTEAVLLVLQPLWQKMPETASRLRGRIEKVLDAARAKGAIPRDRINPATWRGHLEHLLPKRSKLTRGHHAALPYADLPAFVAKLREREAVAARALEFTILTAARSGETMGACWSEIDLELKTWTVPAERMKAGRPHRVPLPERAIAILEEMAAVRTGELVFPGQRAGRPLSNMALEMILRRMGADGVTVHGFRSAFRDWAGDRTSYQREVIEAALAHVIGDRAEQAYRRSDALEKRRELMQAWAAYCEPDKPANVIALRGRSS